MGSSLNVHEVLSGYAQRNKGFKVESLDHYDEERTNGRKPSCKIPADIGFDTVAFRCDFADWLDHLPAAIAKSLNSSVSATAPPTPPLSSA